MNCNYCGFEMEEVFKLSDLPAIPSDWYNIGDNIFDMTRVFFCDKCRVIQTLGLIRVQIYRYRRMFSKIKNTMRRLYVKCV